MAETKHFDVVIVGGGMVGAALACALAETSLSIAVIEREPPQAFDPDQPHDLRVSALSIASQNLLENLGAWQGVLERRACPYQRMRVWEQTQLGDTLFNSADIGWSHLGHIVENRVVQLSLWDRFADFDNLQLYSPAVISEIHCGNDHSEIILASGDSLQCKLLIAADGGGSQVRQAAGLGVMAEEYDQQAFVIYVKTAYPQQDITWQRFYPEGPRAFLPLTGNYGSLVWYDSAERIRHLKSLDDASLMDEIMSAFPAEVGELEAILGRAAFPLKRQHALSYGKAGVALVGDAAHLIHPLAGQGVNIGFLDAAALAGKLRDAVEAGDDIGSAELIKSYESERRRHNSLMMTTMDMFYRVFKDEHKPVQLIRNLGLHAAQKITPARNKAMKFAMGIEGPLPALAKKAG